MAQRRGAARREPGPDGPSELEEIAGRLTDLARRLFLTRPHSRDVVRSLPPVELSFRVDFGGRDESRRAQAQAVFAQLEAHIDDAILANAAFRPGSIFCFFCERADCDHANPPDPRQVFMAYSETGLPQWVSLLDLALQREAPDLDHLARDHGPVVSIASSRDELIGERLSSFADKDRAYDIRGQLALGYYSQNGEKFAVTLQVIRSATRSRAVRLGLNVIGRLPDGRGAEAALIDGGAWSYLTLVQAAERSLARVNQDLKRLPVKQRLDRAGAAAADLMRDMVHGFGRKQRRGSWRTGHASQRAEEGSRPTGMARRDLEAARADRVYFDRMRKTWIIMGARGRTHVFSTKGLHITSLHLDGKSVESRVVQRRWQPADQAQVDEIVGVARRVFEGGECEPRD